LLYVWCLMACHAKTTWYSNCKCTSTVPDGQRSSWVSVILFPVEACDFMDSCLGLCIFFLSLFHFFFWPQIRIDQWPAVLEKRRVQECLIWDTDKVLFVVLWMTPFLFWRLVPFPHLKKGAYGCLFGRICVQLMRQSVISSSPVSDILFFFVFGTMMFHNLGVCAMFVLYTFCITWLVLKCDKFQGKHVPSFWPFWLVVFLFYAVIISIDAAV
jgi:hypothetical protein